jgi:hypothetical protein
MSDQLTEDDFDRIDHFPNTIHLSKELIEERKSLGKRLCQRFIDVDDTLDEKTKKVYEKYPMWCFYEDVNTGLPKRVYGVGWMEDGSYRLHTIACLMLYSNDAIGGNKHDVSSSLLTTNEPASGTSPDSLRKIDNWSKTQLIQMELNRGGSYYADPLGFYQFLLSRLDNEE